MRTSTAVRGRPQVDSNKCNGCGACVSLCPTTALRIVDNPDTRKMELNLSRCIFCGRCGEICPEGAINGQNERDNPSRKAVTIKETELDLLRCIICNNVVGATKAIKKIAESKEIPQMSNDLLKRNKSYCDRCKRFVTARAFDLRHCDS
jgi:ferredoxin